MSVAIETTDELLGLLKKLNLKVSSVEELRHLLTTINANYNPEAARQSTGKRIGVVVPSGMATAAAITSFFLLGARQSTPTTVGGLALIWGACALVSVAAILASAIMTGTRRGRAMPDSPPERQPSSPRESSVTDITKLPPL